jgi:serine/threonine protein kinase
LAKALHSTLPDYDADQVVTVRNISGMNTLGGVIAGTPAYMSPEQARGEYASIGPQSDVFTLGLILAELLSLTRVYRQSGFYATLEAAKCPGGEVDIRKLTPGISFSQGLDRIVRRATHPDIARRYPNAGELSVDMARLIEEQLPPSSIKRFINSNSEKDASAILAPPAAAPAALKVEKPGNFWLGLAVGLAAGAALVWLLSPAG